MRGGSHYHTPIRRDWNKWTRAPSAPQEADINLRMDDVPPGNTRKRPRHDDLDERIHLTISDEAPSFDIYHRNAYRPQPQARQGMLAGQGRPPANAHTGNTVVLPFHPRVQGSAPPEPGMHPGICRNGTRPEPPGRGVPPTGPPRRPWQPPPSRPPPSQRPPLQPHRQNVRGDAPSFPRSTPGPSVAPTPRPGPPAQNSDNSELGGFLAILRQDQEVLEREHGVDGAMYNFYRPPSMGDDGPQGQSAEVPALAPGGGDGGQEQPVGEHVGANAAPCGGPMVFPQDVFLADASCTRLHHEILAFCRQLLPTREERRRKDVACETFMSVILRLWPTCHVSLFGSYATNLYLPGSDIDVAVLFSGPPATDADGGLKAANIRTGALSKPALRRKLETLAQELRSSGLIREMRKIPFAKVPIIKCVNQQGVVCDIAFDACNGPLAVPLVRSLLAKYPALHPLCLVLKVWLLQRGFNEVFTGGIGSYCLINMIVCHIQLHGSERDLGKLLLSFFRFFGTAFDYEASTIAINRGGLVPKTHKGWVDAKKYLLSVEDPQDPDMDIGKASFNIPQIRSQFAQSAHALQRVICLRPPPDGTDNAAALLGHSPALGAVLRCKEALTRIPPHAVTLGNGVIPPMKLKKRKRGLSEDGVGMAVFGGNDDFNGAGSPGKRGKKKVKMSAGHDGLADGRKSRQERKLKNKKNTNKKAKKNHKKGKKDHRKGHSKGV